MRDDMTVTLSNQYVHEMSIEESTCSIHTNITHTQHAKTQKTVHQTASLLNVDLNRRSADTTRRAEQHNVDPINKKSRAKQRKVAAEKIRYIYHSFSSSSLLLIMLGVED
ncbi:MAG: hypothetical protein ACI8RD_011498 [Bacillariaceae sp.]|jgi:hypothetical protein